MSCENCQHHRFVSKVNGKTRTYIAFPVNQTANDALEICRKQKEMCFPCSHYKDWTEKQEKTDRLSKFFGKTEKELKNKKLYIAPLKLVSENVE